MIAPPKIAGMPSAITVTTGISDVAQHVHQHAPTARVMPLARAVRT